jgi:hypothetical protein
MNRRNALKILAASPLAALGRSVASAVEQSSERPNMRDIQHVDVFRERGRYGGHPANGGLWSWDRGPDADSDEIVVGFHIGWTDQAKLVGHPVKGGPDSGHVQARSLDGGVTWTLEPRFVMPKEQTPTVHPGGIDFTHPDFALKILCSGVHAGATSWFYTSTDRCRTWDGPFVFPNMGLSGVAARTDYQVYGPNECLLFLSAPKEDGYEGRAFCARTRNGGASFEFVSWIGPEYDGWTIMPASVRMPSGRLLAALRCFFRPDRGLQIWSSDDDGHTWELLSEPVPRTPGGNPPAMILLADGRIALTWGWRNEPYGIRAWISGNDGATWSDPIILREGGGTDDVGYPRTVQRSDGKVVTVYYYNDPPDEAGTIADRYIGATIWQP